MSIQNSKFPPKLGHLSASRCQPVPCLCLQTGILGHPSGGHPGEVAQYWKRCLTGNPIPRQSPRCHPNASLIPASLTKVLLTELISCLISAMKKRISQRGGLDPPLLVLQKLPRGSSKGNLETPPPLSTFTATPPLKSQKNPHERTFEPSSVSTMRTFPFGN